MKEPAFRPEIKSENEWENNRARIFMPFDALKGFREALKSRERITVPRNELSDEQTGELNRLLTQLKPGEMITAVYYSHGEYVRAEGLVSQIDRTRKILRIAGTPIPFTDIADLHR